MDATEIEKTAEAAADAWDAMSPVIGFLQENWLALALTGEIVGAVIAIKFRHYCRGLMWLLAALATVWAGALG